MKLTAYNKAIVGGFVAGLSLLGLAAVPALASQHNATPTTAQNPNPRSTPTKPPVSTTQQPQTQEQMSRMMAQCTSMMNMMQNGRGMMPGMMNGKTNPAGQGMMNRTNGQ